MWGMEDTGGREALTYAISQHLRDDGDENSKDFELFV